MQNQNTKTITCFKCSHKNSMIINLNHDFECTLCGIKGYIDNNMELYIAYKTLQTELAEQFGQLRLPGI